MAKENDLYIFDFDGTITSRDSLLHFLAFSKKRSELFIGYMMILPFVILMKLKLYSNEKAKIKLFSFHFKGTPKDEFVELCKDFGKNELPKIIKPSFLEYVDRLRQENAKAEMVIVSASLNSYLRYWCEEMRFNLLATVPEFENSFVSGRFATNNCHGGEKVIRIIEEYTLSDYKTIYVFGDTAGDLPMMKLGDKSYYKYFK
ncbi:MAG TPA: HAD-IB family phosphatase [Eudoraea sp.]|nr:HAD-IB family phosphatase [Eudoraea sp.]